jgi:hypothetical protein
MNNKSLKKYGWPQHPSRIYLNRIYRSDIPPPDKFTTTGMNRSELDRFLWPFRIDPRDFETHFGFNLDQPLDHFFENQLQDFVDNILENDNHPLIEITKRIVKRMGRTGCLYRHGFQPKSPSMISAESIKKVKQLELEINRLKMLQKKRKQFEEERSVQRKKARKLFDSLHQEEQNYLLQEYDHAEEHPTIISIGGKLEDFLIIQFHLKISIYEEMKSTHNIGMRLEEIITNLDDIIRRYKNDNIDSAEFVAVYKASEIELNKLDSEFKNILTA